MVKESILYLFETIGFFLEMLFFSLHGFLFAIGKQLLALVSFGCGLGIALIVGKLIYRRGKKDK